MPNAGLGVIHPVVDAVEQAIVRMLGISGDSEGSDLSLFVTLQVSIRVFAEPKLGRFLNQDSALHELYGPRHDQSVEKNRRLVHEGVTVGILKDNHPTNGVAFR